MKTRKSNKVKSHSRGCRNNGPCKICTGDRTHANKRAEPVILLDELLRASPEVQDAMVALMKIER